MLEEPRTDLRKKSKVDVLQIWGNPRSMTEDSFVDDARNATSKVAVLQIRAACARNAFEGSRR